MKILLSAYVCKPHRGAEDGYGWYWAKSLSEMNHDVWVLTLEECQKLIEQEPEVHSRPNLHFVYLKPPNEPPNNFGDRLMSHTRFNWQYSYFRWQHEALNIAQKLDREFDFDLVHHVTWGSATAGSRLWQLNKPFIFGPVGGGQTAPDSLKMYFLDQWNNEKLRSLLFSKLAKLNWFFRRTVSQADLVLATNIDTQELALRSGAKRAELFFDPGLPDNYFPEQFPQREVKSELKLLWVGSVIPRKGLRLSLESLAKVNSRIPFKLTIVGDGSQSKYISQWITELGLEDRVNYLGRLPWLKLKNLYCQSDALFFTTLRDSCPTQFLEAMSHGLPIISLNIHGARKFIPDHAGIKINVTTVEQTLDALANAVEYLYDHPAERITMGKIGYEFAQTQSWSNKAQQATEHYHQVLNQQ